MKLLNKHKYELLFLVIFLVSRAPFMGLEIFNTDVWKWKSRIYDFGTGVFSVEFDKTLQKYHPGVTLMWAGVAAIKFQGLYCLVISCPNENSNFVDTVFALHFFQKLFVILLTGIALTAVFYPLRKMFGKKYAFTSLLLLSFEPFFYALTRVIHLEGLTTSFLLASLVWLFYFLDNNSNKSNKRLVASSVFAGLALLTKSSAAIIVPFSLLTILVYQRKHIKTMLRTCAIWLAVVVAAYFILWPSMWVQPLKTLDYVFIKGVKETGVEGGHNQFYFGNYTENPGVGYYLVVAGYKFSPFLITGIILSLLFLPKILGHFKQAKSKRFVLLLLIFSFLYLIEITLPSKKLDRYILPALASLSLLAGFFFTWFIFVVLPKRGRYIIFALFSVIIMYQSLSLTPDYFSYYNPMFGGLKNGIFVLEPKWVIGQHKLAGYFENILLTDNLKPFDYSEQSFTHQKDLLNKLVVAFPEKYYTQTWPFIRKVGGWAVVEGLTPEASKATYFVYPVWDDYSHTETRFNLEYYDSVYLRGIKLYNVYKRV